MIRQTFSKKEKICSRKILTELFEKGKSAHHYPIRMVWMEIENKDGILAKIAVSVPKKSFKKAVERNRIKRLMRESYRQNKYLLQNYCTSNNKTLAILFVYTGKVLPDYEEVRAKIILSLKRFQD
jgi:ribonuclease P protein component